MVTSRTLHTATLLPDGRVLVVGGVTEGPDPVATAELYDPASGTWTLTGAMSVVRFGHTATLLRDGRVLVTSGSSAVIDGASLGSAELWDPDTGLWTTAKKMTEARQHHSATLLRDGRVLVAGDATAELFDSATGSWTATGGLVDGRIEPPTTLLADGTVLAPTAGATARYDPGTGTWSMTATPTIARSSHTATLLASGRLLMAGGSTWGVDDSLASADLFDPATGNWAATGAMNERRLDHTATLLPDGRVLVVGGRGLSPYSRARITAELYDPATGAWSATPDLNSDHSGHTATLLADGRVLVAGGSGGLGSLAEAELYGP